MVEEEEVEEHSKGEDSDPGEEQVDGHGLANGTTHQ